MTSKELLSEVFGWEVVNVLDSRLENEITLQGAGKLNFKNINIHELANKCKKWAFKQGYETVERKNQVDVYIDNKRIAQFIGDKNHIFTPKRVFESCEWVRKQKDNK